MSDNSKIDYVEAKSSPVEPGTINEGTERAAQFCGVAAKKEGTARDDEFECQANRSAGTGNQRPLGITSIESKGDRGALWIEAKHGLLYSPSADMETSAIGLVIIGSQTGRGAAPIDPQWVADLTAQCDAAMVPVFHKRSLLRYGFGRWDVP